jgi:hypothetical protein
MSREVPAAPRSRLLSVRAFDGAGMLIDADVAEGRSLESVIGRRLDVPLRSDPSMEGGRDAEIVVRGVA